MSNRKSFSDFWKVVVTWLFANRKLIFRVLKFLKSAFGEWSGGDSVE